MKCFKWVTETPEDPAGGERRIVTKFLWWPKTITQYFDRGAKRQETRWLCKTSWEEEWITGWSCGGFWEEKRFID